MKKITIRTCIIGITAVTFIVPLIAALVLPPPATAQVAEPVAPPSAMAQPNSNVPEKARELASSPASVLRQGEQLYQGKANFAAAQDFTVRFVLSADKKEVRSLTVTITGLKVTARHANMRIEQTITKSETKFSNPFPVLNNKVDANLGNEGKLSLAFDKTGVSGTIEYIHTIRASAEHPDIPVNLGKSPVHFQAQQ